jgi:hypothetical protein
MLCVCRLYYCTFCAREIVPLQLLGSMQGVLHCYVGCAMLRIILLAFIIYCSQAMNPHPHNNAILSSCLTLSTVTRSPCIHAALWNHVLSLKQHTVEFSKVTCSQSGTWDAVAGVQCCEVMCSKAPPPTFFYTLLSCRYSGVYCRKTYVKMCRCPECKHVQHDSTCCTADVNAAGLNKCDECLYQVGGHAFPSLFCDSTFTQPFSSSVITQEECLIYGFDPFTPTSTDADKYEFAEQVKNRGGQFRLPQKRNRGGQVELRQKKRQRLG